MKSRVTVIDTMVTEWDIVSANISVLAEEGLISEDTYRDLRETDKQSRVVLIGTIMRELQEREDYDLSKDLDNLIRKYIDKFITENGIKNSNILEIAKDAVFLTNVNPKITKFGDYVKFVKKSQYMYMIEFPVSKNDSRKIKLYKSKDEIKCRGARVSKRHPAYVTLNRLMSDAINKDTRNYAHLLKNLIRFLNIEKEYLVNGVDNEYLITIFQEVFNLI